MPTFKLGGRSISIPDATYRRIHELDEETGTRAFQFIAVARYYGVPVEIRALGARRTSAQQTALVQAGKSKTMNSRHLEGRAFDIDIQGWNRDSIPKEFWPWVAEVASSVGLKQPLPSWDPGHLET